MYVIIKKILILTLLLFSQFILFSQGITEDNYHKTDKAIWDDYELKMADLVKTYELHPDKKDSLINVANEIEKNANKKNCEAAIKFASVPSGLKRLYMVRLNISRDTLRSVFNSLPKEMQKSEYGKSVLLHIKTNQIEEGDKFYNFKAIDSNGDKFILSNLKGNNILLLYGGLGCIREEGRKFLKEYNNAISSDNFKIVVFNPCSDLEELKSLKSKYELDFIFISDFLKDHSPIKIHYGAQATPTCFLINEEGKIVVKSIGLPENKLEELKDKLI